MFRTLLNEQKKQNEKAFQSYKYLTYNLLKEQVKQNTDDVSSSFFPPIKSKLQPNTKKLQHRKPARVIDTKERSHLKILSLSWGIHHNCSSSQIIVTRCNNSREGLICIFRLQEGCHSTL